ncbi:MAG TPA: hypothetical protein VGE37_16005 [Archangium sp.]
MSSEYSPQNVVVLEGLEPVRLRPGMYVGGIGPQGLEVMVLEAISNAADQHLTGRAQRIDVRVSSDDSVTIRRRPRSTWSPLVWPFVTP